MEKNINQTDLKTAKAITRKEEYIAKEEARRHSSMHITAFVLGIISVVGNLFWYISIPCGVLAIIFGAKSSRALGSKLGKAGLILGIVGTALTIFIYISIILLSLNDYLY